MSGQSSTDEAFVLKLSVVLLCFLSLLGVFVVLLFLWLRKINQRVNDVCKKWSIYSKLALNVEQTETENLTEIKNTSPFPLVLFNKLNKPSEKCQTGLKTWKSIKRDFAYARTDPVEIDNPPCSEGTSAADEDEISFDCQNIQEETLARDSEDASPVTPASCSKIANGSPALLFLTGGNSDEEVVRRRNFVTLKGEQEDEEAFDVSAPVQKKRLVLVEAEPGHVVYEDETTFLPNGTIIRKTFPKRPVHAQLPQEPNEEKPAPENVEVKKNTGGVVRGDKLPGKDKEETREDASGVSQKNSVPRNEDEAEYCILTECKPKEKNGAAGVVHGGKLPGKEKEENRAGASRVSDKNSVPRLENEAEYCIPTECKPKVKHNAAGVIHGDKLRGRDQKENRVGASGVSDKNSVPPHEDEADYFIPTECKPKVKNNAVGVVHGDKLQGKDQKVNRAGTSGVSDKNSVPPHKDETEYSLPSECKPKEIRKQKQRPSGRKSKQRHKTSGERVTPLKKLNEGERGGLNTAQHSAGKLTEDHKGEQPRVNVPINRRHTTGTAAKRRGVQSKHYEGDKGTSDYMTTRDKSHVTPNSQEMGAQDNAEEIYSNIDDNNMGVRETSASAHAQTVYVNFKSSEHLDEQFLDDSLIYSNVDDVVEHESTRTQYDNPGFDNADEGPIYVNLKEMFDI